MCDLSQIETKLSAARTRLILEKPFLGALVMHLPLVAAGPWCRTTGTDAKAFYYNPEFIAPLDLDQTQFMLAHEALHCALGHFARRHHRMKHRWDVACDHAVNLLLAAEGMKAPEGALFNRLYENLTAEEIYPLIQQGSSEKTLDHHLFDGMGDEDQGKGEGESDVEQTAGGGRQGEQRQSGESGGGRERRGGGQGKEEQPEQDAGLDEESRERPSRLQQRPPDEPGLSEKEEMAAQWRQRLASVAQQARQAGRLGESWMRVLDELLQPKLPWRMLLARYMMSMARDDYSFQRPSRREGEALLPSLYSDEVNVVVALDTSGSVSDEEMREFVGEIDALKGQVRARVTLHACDERLSEHGPWVFQSWDPLALPRAVSGGGGTRFTPVFEWVERDNLRPDLLLYFTDAEGEFPPHAPAYPVIWLVKGKADVPWGQRIQLN